MGKINQANLANSNFKKRKPPKAAEAPYIIDDEVQPVAKKPKVPFLNINQAKNELYIYLSLYNQQKMSLDKFKEEFKELWANVRGNFHLLSPFFPISRVKYITVLREAFKQDEFFEWILNEIELCMENALEDSISFVQHMIGYISSEARLSKLLSRPKINECVFKYGIATLITHIASQGEIKKNPLALLQQYFSAEQFEQLKHQSLVTDATGDMPVGKTLLEILLSLDIEYILDFWKAGFKPYSQKHFNTKLFFAGARDEYTFKKVMKVYGEIVSSEEYRDLLVFPEESNQVLMFLSNSAIDKEVFAQLLEKKKLAPDLQTLMDFIREVKPAAFNRTEINHFIGKIIYIVSAFELSLNQPAAPSFLNSVETMIMDAITPALFQYGLSHSLFTCNSALLQPNTTLADELLFYCANLKRDDKSNAQIETLFHLLTAKQGEQSNLWQILLNAYFIKFVLMPWNKEIRSAKLAEYLQDFFVKFAPNITIVEKQQLIIHFSSFASDLIRQFQQYSERPQIALPERKRYLLQIPVDPCLAFIAGIMNTIPEQFILPQASYYQLATLLFIQLYPQDIERIESNIKDFISYYNGNANQRELRAQILAQLMGLFAINRLIISEELIAIVSVIEPMWIFRISSELSLHGNTPNLFSVLLRQLLTKEPGFAEQNARTISNLLSQLIDNKEVMLPLDFLQGVADCKHDLQKRATLSPAVQEWLEIIYNQCINKVQGTEQEHIFEEMRTQLLLKFDADPTKNSQAIHTHENHQFADKIFDAWTLSFVATPEESTHNYKQGLEAFTTYLQKEKNKKVSELIVGMNESQLRGYIQFVHGDVYDAQEFQPVVDQINLYTKVARYLSDLLTRANHIITPVMSLVEERSITDAKKLIHMIAMAAYYSTSEQSPPPPFAVHKSPEVLHILLLELLDQVERPSCDQGPFIRLFMALEPVAEYKFPYLTRKSIHFYAKEYINNHYNQLVQEEKNYLIATIYGKIEFQDNLDKIDFLPENTVTFLAARFLEENKDRIGFITSKEIEYLFFMERPQEYHPEIVQALNQWHQGHKKVMIPTTHNQNRFFMSRSADDISAPMELDVFLEQPPVNDGNDDLMDLDV